MKLFVLLLAFRLEILDWPMCDNGFLDRFRSMEYVFPVTCCWQLIDELLVLVLPLLKLYGAPLLVRLFNANAKSPADAGQLVSVNNSAKSISPDGF